MEVVISLIILTKNLLGVVLKMAMRNPPAEGLALWGKDNNALKTATM